MEPAALVERADHDLADRLDQAALVVGDHQAQSGQAVFTQGAQEVASEGLGLAVADHHAQDFTAAVFCGDGDGDGLGGDLKVDRGP